MSLVYKNSMKLIGKVVPEKLQPLWNHPAGPQTIFFWAPAFKWHLYALQAAIYKGVAAGSCAIYLPSYILGNFQITGIGDLQRPASKISISQSSALGMTGLIWTRYSLAITPKNWSLFSVNLFVAFTALYQVARAVKYQRDLQVQESTGATMSTNEKDH